MSYENPPPSDPYGQPAPPSPGSQPSAKGFFGALFDVSFEHFATPTIVKIFYILSMIGLGLAWLVYLLFAFSVSSGLGIAVLILGPILILLYLCLIRMTLELYLAVNRMSQDIHQRLR